MSETSFDPSRRLCPDGACVGVIGDDGHCKVCGRASGGGPTKARSAAPALDPADDFAASDDADSDSPKAAADAAGASGFDTSRRLCADGGCVGVIGPDGTCKVCGQPAA